MVRTVSEINAAGIDGAALKDICAACQPLILRGLVADWPATQAARQSPQALRAYLAPFETQGDVGVFVGDRRIAGKYYYGDDLRKFNFERRTMPMAKALDLVIENLDRADGPSVYVGSVVTDRYLPGFARVNATPFFGPEVGPRIWIGHASNVSCHYDTFENVACVVAGERRFTLFPPEAIGDLYVGPIDNTMSGQPVSLAASADQADLAKYPNFARALEKKLVAELKPGDALYLPKLWWHQVEALSPFNCLVNYWWDAFQIGVDPPASAIFLAMMTIAERPAAERQAWKAYFDYFVFRTNGHPLEHVPPDQRGVLGSLSENYGRLRAHLIQMLTRPN